MLSLQIIKKLIDRCELNDHKPVLYKRNPYFMETHAE